MKWSCECCDAEVSIDRSILGEPGFDGVVYCDDCDDDGHDDWLRECGVYQQWDMMD